ncbi:putative RNA-directed DNA polymerase [Helianthus annuus]|nr:putative RNA-directed DNA polymerase [Helianthus annuus]
MNFLSVNIRGLGGSCKSGWVKDLRRVYGINFVAIQESKQSSVSVLELKKFWGSGSFGLEVVDAVGLSGGLICLWDDQVFKVVSSTKNRNFIHIKGELVGSGVILNVLNVYAHQGVSAKSILWNSLVDIISGNSGQWVLGGDFNAVRFREERRNCSFKPTCANNFNSFIYNAGLREYHLRGRAFTWQSENGKKLSKLDRFLVNSEFFDSWPEARCQALPRSWSDHCPIILIAKSVNFGARPFRVFNSWMEKEGFDKVVEDACSSFSLSGCTPDVFFIKKLGFIRSKVREWRDNMLKKEGEEVSLAQEEVDSLEKILDRRELSEIEEWVLAENKKIITDAEIAKVSDLRQRSRVRWAKDGDENSKFFHSVINSRKASNVIHGLNIGGEWVSKPSLVKKEIFNFFRGKFVEDYRDRPPLVCPNIVKISDDVSVQIESKFSVEEIKAAVFECGDDRAPGPDGFNFRFYKRYWSLFVNDFVSIMDYFHETGVINVGCGSSFIALIPKRRDPLGLNDYRPISLVGVVNKVVSKVLANRLKRVLEPIISVSQSAFLSGRSILDGPLVINEVCSWLKKHKKKALLLKIDFEKAYDNISWKFVLDVLSQMGFGSKWCSWIWGILSSARASVLVNGSPTFEFNCEKGMRQGDPISPFLFVVAMEALSCLVSMANEVGVFSGIQLPNDGPNLSHLFFADDAIFVGEWEEGNALNIVRILRCFFACSGLKINFSKSNLFGIGVTIEDVVVMADLVGCAPDSLPFKYLGLKVGANMNRVNNWRPVYDLFESRLALWKSPVLSFGGKVTLIRSVLESLPSYFFSLFVAPGKVIKDLESIVKKFLWGGTAEVRKTHWVAWDRVSIPKKKGGLGLSKLKNSNLSLLCKWGWRYKREKNSMWVKVVDAIHLGGSAWSFLPFMKAIRGVWHNIVSAINKPFQGKPPLRNYFRGLVGRGDQILFWLDPWLDNVPLKCVYPNLFALEVVKTCSVSDRLGGVWLWRHDPVLEEETAEFDSLVAALLSVSLNDKKDEWKWKVLMDISDIRVDYVLEWCGWVPNKCNILVWRSEMKRIPTADALLRRGIMIGEGLCPFCKSVPESVDHIFTSCFFAVVLWQKISRWCHIPPIFAFSFKDLLEIHKGGHISVKDRVVIQGIIYISCWSIWATRNKIIFSNSEFKADKVFSDIKSLGFLWYKHRSRCSALSWVDWCKFVNM